MFLRRTNRPPIAAIAVAKSPSHQQTPPKSDSGKFRTDHRRLRECSLNGIIEAAASGGAPPHTPQNQIGEHPVFFSLLQILNTYLPPLNDRASRVSARVMIASCFDS